MTKFAVTAFLLATLGLNMAVPSLAAHSIRVYTIPGRAVSQPVEGSTRPQAPVYLAQATVSDAQVRQVQTILDHLKAANSIPAEISPVLKIQNSNQLNAATDGETILITSGLLAKLQTDDQRAFVISHELAHILLQHIGKTQVRRIGLSLLDAFLVRRYTQEGSLAQLASRLGIGLVDRRSSRGYEYQADDLGVKLMTEAGYNPQSAIEVFGILQAATPGNRTPEFLQSHPISESRIRALVQKYKLSAK
jgi:predicted Zn-dependent protease